MYYVVKKYKFYAAHRNPMLSDKCKNLHGHRYGIEITLAFKELKDSGESLLFSSIDELMDPLIKKLDHSLLIWDKDPLLKYLEAYEKDTGDSLKIQLFPYQTSAENIAKFIYDSAQSLGLPIAQSKVLETDSSEVIFKPV
jgi:6-pyruvoyltetrahydropterin/6-carboxytetrahydropterin synthase